MECAAGLEAKQRSRRAAAKQDEVEQNAPAQMASWQQYLAGSVFFEVLAVAAEIGLIAERWRKLCQPLPA